MNHSMRNSTQESAANRPPDCADSDPVVLALPRGPGADLDHLHVIETGCGPKSEVDLFVELLRRSPGLAASLADTAEVQNYPNPLAGVNAYRHRMHALRCEYVNARVQALDLEEQLTAARERIQRLENHVQFLDNTLQQMRLSRAWKTAEQCSRWGRTVTRWLGNLRHLVTKRTNQSAA